MLPQKHGDVAMPGVSSFASLVAEQIDPAETRRAQHLRLLRRLRDLHRRVDAAPARLARLVPTHSREEEEFGGNAGSHSGTHPSGEAVAKETLCPAPTI